MASTKVDLNLDIHNSSSARNETILDNFYFHNNVDEPIKICAISAILGSYEKTAKEPLEPQLASQKLFLATDQPHLLNSTANNNNTAWTRIAIDHSLWEEDCKKEEFVGAKNNPCDRPYFLFNIAKFYKMQPYRVPQIREAGCNVVIWLDGTIQIKTANFMTLMADRAYRGQNFVVYVLDGKARRGGYPGTMEKEVNQSKYGKYGGKRGLAFGPPQHVNQQHEFYIQQGFREKWFVNEPWFEEKSGLDKGKYGQYVTCMVLLDLRKSETKEFLDCWWRENILRSTQDQVGFPYCAWKYRTPIQALPDKEAPGKYPIGWVQDNMYFHKLDHGN